MVSDIIRLPMYDRTWILITAIYAFGVHQVNIRAYFKRLYNMTSHKANDFLIILGTLSCISLPLIGIFDEVAFTTAHYSLALTFYSTCTIYALILTYIMHKHKN